MCPGGSRGLTEIPGAWPVCGTRGPTPASGELVESYTMLTINADDHPLMGRMHRPDPKRPPNMQDKRSVVPIELADVDAWLHAPLEQAAALVKLAPAQRFEPAAAGGA